MRFSELDVSMGKRFREEKERTVIEARKENKGRWVGEGGE